MRPGALDVLVLADGSRCELTGAPRAFGNGTIVPVSWRGEPATLVLIEHRPELDRALAGLRDEVDLEAGVVMPRARGRLAVVEAGYREDGRGAGASGDAYLLFRPRRGATLAALVGRAWRGSPCSVAIACALVARLAQLVGRGRTRFDPFVAGLDETGVWMLAPELEALFRAMMIGRIDGRWLGYRAPEALKGGARPEHSAMFGLGVLLFELLAGRPLFERATGYETVRAISEARPPSLTRLAPGVPVEVAALALALVERDPLVRPSPATVEATLRPHASPDPDWARAISIPFEDAPFLRLL